MATFVFFAIFGLIIGSFLGVVLCRLAAGERITGRSFCRACGKQLRWRENIPIISFLMLGGRCRSCREPIPRTDLFMEGATALLFGAVGLVFFDAEMTSRLETLWLLFLVAILLLIAAYDYQFLEIPLLLLYVGIFGTLVYYLVSAWLFPEGVIFWESAFGQGILGGAAVAFFFFLLVYVSRETWMGWGDVWLGGLSGLAVGLEHAFFLLTLSFTVGAIVGLGLLFYSGKQLKTQIPFAPFLVVGTLTLLFLKAVQPTYIELFIG